MSGILRALSVCAPLVLVETPAALAQTFAPSALSVAIPAQPLARALEAFARQTGLQLVYVSTVVRDQRSHAVVAGLSADAAIGRMLEGTGLEFQHLTARSIRIIAAESDPQRESGPVPLERELQTVIVTANRREENLQSVPITIQVLTGEKLAQLNATTFDDFVRYLPGVTAHGVGPGQNNIYVRGLATAVAGVQGSGIGGIFPNVAVYLDEQSGQLAHRNLDVYAADLERIEILEGPQGTLFGAGAEAGVVRYITNKPKLNVTEAAANGGYASTAHGGTSGNVDAMVNLPLIADTLAVRGVIYNEHRGGYIDNLPATFARADTDLGVQYYGFPGGKIPANSVVVNNVNIAARDINPVTYEGLRVEALYQINDDWSALLAQSYQSMEADGVFAEMAQNSLGQPQPGLTAQLFNPSYDKDRFENTGLTVDGRIGPLKLVYAGSYLSRNIEQVQDYTNYARALNVDYYQCANPGPTPATFQCFTPSSTWHDRERNTHQSHELRVSTPDQWRIRGIGGLFYENYRIQEQVDFDYLSAIPFFHPIGPPTGYYTASGDFVPYPVTSNNPNVRPSEDGFFNDITQEYRQKAAFASIDVDLIPHTLTLTAGTRYFRTATSEVGSSVGSFYCQLLNPLTAPVPNPCVNHSDFINIDSEGLHRTFTGFRSRANLSWRVTDDAMLYYTWSQGFRPGGFNRMSFPAEPNSPLSPGAGSWQAQARLHEGWVAPAGFAPDNLTNNEFGWKTLWLGRRLQWNGAIYQEDWSNAQISVFANGLVSYAVNVNGGSYRVRGAETSGVARITTGFTVEAAAAWSHSELVKQAPFFWADGQPIDFGLLETSQQRSFPNPAGALGSPLAGAPSFEGNIRARYEFTVNGYNAFAQIGAVRQSHSLATTNQLADLQGNSTAYDLAAFTTYDGALGVGKDAWLVQVYGQNLTDSRAELYANYAEWYKAVTVSRPRTLGVRVSYKLSGH